ncbi:MAG: hypothetical protein HQM10_11755 [Candidatus Riflebacteria bacterium]|nr:hypothetical protein [Candidatus Riflebacteria bacterium]
MNRNYCFAAVIAIMLLSSVNQADCRDLSGGRGIPVVSDAKDLNLVNFKNMSDFLYSDLKEKGSFGPVRRLALDIKAKQMGIPNPRKSTLHGGCVISKGQSNNSSAILVIAGDLTFKDLKSVIEKDYKEYMSENNGKPEITEDEVGGHKFSKYAYSERPYEVCLAQIPEKKLLVIGAIPKSDYSVLENTLSVLNGEEKLNEKTPDSVQAETVFTLTKREIERIAKFNRPRGQLRKIAANGIKSLAQKLGIPHSDDESVPLEERIRGQIALSEQISIKYNWDVDPQNTSAYDIIYTVKTKSSENAEVLKGLLAEQITRLSEKSPWEAEKESLGKLTVSAKDQDVQVSFLLDTPEAQYQHLSLLLGQVFQYRSLLSYLDRNGSSKN